MAFPFPSFTITYQISSFKGFIVSLPSRTNAAAFKLNKTSLSVEIGRSEKLRLTGAPKKVTWSSSSKKIATVSRRGIVTGKRSGQVTITANIITKGSKTRSLK